MDRRAFLATAAVGTAAAMTLTGCDTNGRPALRLGRRRDDWDDVRRRFTLDRDTVHLAGLLLTSHPEPVARAIARYRAELDADPARAVEEENAGRQLAARRQAARYLGASASDVALTDSTTMGIGLVYNGIAIGPGQEILTTVHDYYSTEESLGYRSRRANVPVRRIALHEDAARATEAEIAERFRQGLTPATRVVALTWVHSSTGLKLPLAALAQVVEQANAGRGPAERALLCVDGVHALGVETFRLPDTGCDFFMAGTHKWLHGPRGTGILWGNPATQAAVSPTIPSFTGDGTWGGRMSPGGFKSFEHLWALAEAFAFHEQLGRERVTDRIHALARQTKEGLARMGHVQLHTPMEAGLSAGIVCFDVDGMTPDAVVRQLRNRGIVASTTPYTPSHARITPGIHNTPEEIDAALAAIGDMG
jgi:isopenicillin-N epimerase